MISTTRNSVSRWRRYRLLNVVFPIIATLLAFLFTMLPVAIGTTQWNYVHELQYNEEGVSGQQLSQSRIQFLNTRGIIGSNRTYASNLAKTSYAHEAHFAIRHRQNYYVWSNEKFGWHMGTYTGNFNRIPMDPNPIYHSQPVVFWEIMINYNMADGSSGGVWAQDVAYGGRNTNHTYTINYVGPHNGQYMWSFKIDSTTVAELDNWNPYGMACAGCNRNSTASDCNNYGAFNTMKFKEYRTNTWRSFGYKSVYPYRYLLGDHVESLLSTDPGYRRIVNSPDGMEVVRGVGGGGAEEYTYSISNDISDSPMKSSSSSGEETPETDVFTEYSDVTTAQQSAGFYAKTPRETLGGKVSSVHATTDRPENVVSTEYDNGLLVSASRTDQIDYAARIKSMEDLTEKANIHPDKLPYLIDVAGHQGMLWPAHKNVGDVKPGSAAIYWWDSGVEYQVVGSINILLNDEQAKNLASSFYQ